MTIQELQQSFIIAATPLRNYQQLTKAQLFDGYCDADEAGDEFKRNAFYSALMLRYWYKIFKWMEESASLRLDPSEFVNWLRETLDDTFYYRSWRKLRHDHKAEELNGHTQNVWIDNPQYVEDPNAADKSMNYFTSAKRGKEYQYYNKDKRKSDVVRYSLDSLLDENGDYASNQVGAYTNPDEENKVGFIVVELIKRGEILEALVVDGIANHDSLKETKTKHVTINEDNEGNEVEEKYTSYSHAFNNRKLIKHLNLINQAFMNDFCETYSLEQTFGDVALEKLKALPNGKLYRLVEKTLNELKNEPELLSYLL